MASAPEASRAWLLIEHPGPWPHEAADAAAARTARRPGPVAVELGIRVQMIRRPGRRQVGDVRSRPRWAGPRAASPGCGARRCPRSAPALTERDLKELAAGITAVVRVAGRRAGVPGLHARPAQRLLRAVRRAARAGARRPASRADLGDHARRRAPVRRQPGDPAARPVLRPGRRRTRPPPRSARTSAARCARTLPGPGRASRGRARRPSTRGWPGPGRCRCGPYLRALI